MYIYKLRTYICGIFKLLPMIDAEGGLTLRIVHGNGHVKIHLNYYIVQSLLTICAYRSRFLERLYGYLKRWGVLTALYSLMYTP